MAVTIMEDTIIIMEDIMEDIIIIMVDTMEGTVITTVIIMVIIITVIIIIIIMEVEAVVEEEEVVVAAINLSNKRVHVKVVKFVCSRVPRVTVGASTPPDMQLLMACVVDGVTVEVRTWLAKLNPLCIAAVVFCMRTMGAGVILVLAWSSTSTSPISVCLVGMAAVPGVITAGVMVIMVIIIDGIIIMVGVVVGGVMDDTIIITADTITTTTAVTIVAGVGVVIIIIIITIMEEEEEEDSKQLEV
jgi:hypothetical protein